MSIILSAGLVGLLPDARFVPLRQGEGMTTAARRHRRRQVALLAVCVAVLAAVVLFAVLNLAGVT